MLKIKQTFHLSFPHIQLRRTQPVQFTPVTDDNDELTQAIATDTAQHDDEWELDERPDTTQLEAYWDEVEDDIEHDPKWIKFSDEDAS
jgi:hypothetical protein